MREQQRIDKFLKLVERCCLWAGLRNDVPHGAHQGEYNANKEWQSRHIGAIFAYVTLVSVCSLHINRSLPEIPVEKNINQRQTPVILKSKMGC